VASHSSIDPGSAHRLRAGGAPSDANGVGGNSEAARQDTIARCWQRLVSFRASIPWCDRPVASYRTIDVETQRTGGQCQERRGHRRRLGSRGGEGRSRNRARESCGACARGSWRCRWTTAAAAGCSKVSEILGVVCIPQKKRHRDSDGSERNTLSGLCGWH